MPGVLKTLTPYGRGAGHFCVGQSDYERSRETITVAVAAPAMVAGQLLGIVTANGHFTVFNPAAADGTQNFAGILWDDVPDAAVTQKAVRVYRDQPVNGFALAGYAALTTPQKTALIAAAKAMGIIILF
jgi:hypothetical protein